jgi:hypothetical protein
VRIQEWQIALAVRIIWRKKKKRCLRAAHPSADIFLVLEARGQASFQDV